MVPCMARDLEDGVAGVGGVEGVAGGVKGQGGLHRPGPHHLHQGSGCRCRGVEVQD